MDLCCKIYPQNHDESDDGRDEFGEFFLVTTTTSADYRETNSQNFNVDELIE